MQVLYKASKTIMAAAQAKYTNKSKLVKRYSKAEVARQVMNYETGIILNLKSSLGYGTQSLRPRRVMKEKHKFNKICKCTKYLHNFENFMFCQINCAKYCDSVYWENLIVFKINLHEIYYVIRYCYIQKNVANNFFIQ